VSHFWGALQLARNSQDLKQRAEAAFQKRQQRAVEGEKGRAEYEAARRAEAEKTKRLRTLRLAKEESDRQEAVSLKTGHRFGRVIRRAEQ
jgi:hypothetical protein